MHKLVVQAGDDRHATMTGLCETITVNVTGIESTVIQSTVHSGL